MPNLEALSLADLKDLNAVLSVLQQAGAALDDACLNPVFRLVPGEPMSLTVAAVMPEACAAHEELFASGPDVSPDPDRLADLIRQTVASPPAAHGADDAPPAAGHDAAGGVAEAPPEDTPELPACATSSPNGAGKGGGAAENTQPAADTNPGAAVLKPGAPFLPMSGPIWTPDEDARLIELVAGAVVREGLSRNAAAERAAGLMGRPVPGTRYRCHHVLRDRLLARISDLSAEVFAATPADELPDPGPAAAPAAAAPPPDPADLLAAYLDGLPMRDGWTPARDEELMRLACLGWGMNEIAQDMDLRADRVKARYDLLTGHHRDDYGRWVRRFPREDVLAALSARLAPAGEGK